MTIVAFAEIQSAACRGLQAGGAAPGVDEECGWACAWLEACGYPGLRMLVAALEQTPRGERRPAYEPDALGLDLRGISCVFSAPIIAALAIARGRIFLRNVRDGLYLLPFTVRANIGIGCPVDPAFALGGERHKNPYEEKLAAAQCGILVDDAMWKRAAEQQPNHRAATIVT
jgi:hypothetical protein